MAISEASEAWAEWKFSWAAPYCALAASTLLRFFPKRSISHEASSPAEDEVVSVPLPRRISEEIALTEPDPPSEG